MQGFLNLSYARKLSDQFSVGASAIFAMQRFEARGVSTFARTPRPTSKATSPPASRPRRRTCLRTATTCRTATAATLGLIWKPIDAFSLAAAYTSKMTMSDFSDYSDLFAGGGGFDMPSTWTIGVAFKPVEAVTLMFDVQDISYSDVDAVSNPIQNLFNCPIFNQASGSFENCLGGNRGPGFGWDDMTVYKFGASWKYDDEWTLRAGFSITDQPIPNDQMSFNILAPA